METNSYEYDEIELKEIFEIISKNFKFIITFIVSGMLIALILSGIQTLKNPVENLYKAKVTIELINGAEMKNQPDIVLHVMRSTAIENAAKEKLKLTNENFSIRAEAATKPNQYDVIVEGKNPDKNVDMADQIVAQGNAVVSGSMNMSSNTIIEKGHTFGTPVQISKNINYTLNLVIGAVLGTMAAVFMIFLVKYLSGKISSKKEVEKILGTKVLVVVPSSRKKSGYDEFIRVR